MLKPALCAAALAVTAAIAIPAIAQQSPQGENPSAAPAPQAAPEGRGPGWRGYPDGRYSDEDGPGRRWRRRDEGRRDGDDDGPRRWHERRFGGRDGMMPGMMGRGPMMERGAAMQPFGMAHFCGPEGGRMGEMMIGRVERATQPTAEQRAGFDKLKEAAGKAGEIMRAACTTERPVTPTGRLAAAEKRLAAMLEAVRTVRPAMDAYYNSLTDEQKARLTLAQPHMGRRGMGEGWRERMHRWRERTDRDERGERPRDRQPSGEPERL
ncbi:MAG: hypothetical protein E6G97_11645 [Alphaproteobacteria bacterium]|nr:MAG: hypothetical protein E6G97_11645 [Alphaproteobacteria bacterium]